MQNEYCGVTASLCIWKGLTLPIASFSCLRRLQALCSKACLSLGVGMTSHTMQLLSYLVLLGTTLIFLLMIIPCNNPCGGASVANQETVEVNLSFQGCFVVQAELQRKRSLLPCHWLSVTVDKSFPLWRNFMSLKVWGACIMKKWSGVESLV